MKKENTVNYAMILAIILPFVIFGIFMTSQGKSAVNVYIDMIKTVIINKYGFCEVVIKWAPLLLTALAAIIPAKAGISNVGGRLRTTTGSNLGYLGFLAAGIAWNNPIIAIFTTFLISLLTVSGNAMEISSGLPSSTINILMTLVLLAVLCVGRGKKNADI